MFLTSLRRAYEAFYFGLYLYIQLSAGWFLRNTSIMLTCASTPLLSPLPSCSTIQYLVTAVGLFSGTFNFSSSVGTKTLHNTLLSGQCEKHNHKHTDPVQISTISTAAVSETLSQGQSFDYAIHALYKAATKDSPGT